MFFVVALIVLGVGCALLPAATTRLPRTQTRLEGRPQWAEAAGRWSVGAGIVMLFGYQLLFNLIPEHPRVLVASAISGYCLYFLLLVCISVRREQPTGTVWLWLACLVGVDLLAITMGAHSPEVSGFIRKFFPIVLAAYLLRSPSLLPKRLVIVTASATALLGSVYSLTAGSAYYSDVTRLAPFTGGDDGTHSSSYVLVCCMMIVVEAWLARELSTRRALVVLTPACVALVGLAVGTALVMALAYAGARLWGRTRSPAFKVAAIGLAVVALSLVFAQRTDLHEHAEYRSSSTGADAFSSGRLTTWQERVSIIDQRSSKLQLVGAGVGSDHYVSRVWSGYLDSHEDYLTLILENGMLGFFAAMCALGAVFRRAGPSVVPMAVAFLVASSISNALFARPMIACLFFVAVALTSQLNAAPRERVDAGVTHDRSVCGPRPIKAATWSAARAR